MSTLVENVAKVTAAHAALKTAIAAKGVAVPDGTKLTGMPALIEQISTEPVPTNARACFAGDSSISSLVVPKIMVVDMTVTDNLKNFFLGNNMTSITFPEGFGKSTTTLQECFNGCSHLSSLTLPAGFGQYATSLVNAIRACYSLRHLELPAGFGQNATDVSNCFRFCRSMTSLTLPAGFGQNATVTTYCFSGCTALETIIGNPNFKVSVDFSSCTKLTHDSLMVVINGLQTVTETQTLTLGSTNLAKLTDAEKQIATDKGWTLA